MSDAFSAVIISTLSIDVGSDQKPFIVECCTALDVLLIALSV